MTLKALILYASKTGNTEKVAVRFKETFEKKGWQCDIYKVDKSIVNNPPFQYKDYDFLCVGSYVWGSLPSQDILDVIMTNPQSLHGSTSKNKPPKGEPPPELLEKLKEMPKSVHDAEQHRKAIPGTRKGIVFVTYAGAHLGPKEAEPALSMLDMEMEHLELFKCVGRFCCPGKMVKYPTPEYWHGDISQRPDERDLLKAEIFLEEKIEMPYV
jgi:hypothetical protein